MTESQNSNMCNEACAYQVEEVCEKYSDNNEIKAKSMGRVKSLKAKLEQLLMRENLASDTAILQLMAEDGSLNVDTLVSEVSSLEATAAEVLEAAASSDFINANFEKRIIFPELKSQRRTIILRNIPDSTTMEEIRDLVSRCPFIVCDKPENMHDFENANETTLVTSCETDVADAESANVDPENSNDGKGHSADGSYFMTEAEDKSEECRSEIAQANNGDITSASDAGWSSKILSIRQLDISGAWYVTVQDEVLATNVALWLRSQVFKDQVVQVRIKSEIDMTNIDIPWKNYGVTDCNLGAYGVMDYGPRWYSPDYAYRQNDGEVISSNPIPHFYDAAFQPQPIPYITQYMPAYPAPPHDCYDNQSKNVWLPLCLPQGSYCHPSLASIPIHATSTNPPMLFTTNQNSAQNVMCPTSNLYRSPGLVLAATHAPVLQDYSNMDDTCQQNYLGQEDKSCDMPDAGTDENSERISGALLTCTDLDSSTMLNNEGEVIPPPNTTSTSTGSVSCNSEVNSAAAANQYSFKNNPDFNHESENTTLCIFSHENSPTNQMTDNAAVLDKNHSQVDSSDLSQCRRVSEPPVTKPILDEEQEVECKVDSTDEETRAINFNDNVSTVSEPAIGEVAPMDNNASRTTGSDVVNSVGVESGSEFGVYVDKSSINSNGVVAGPAENDASMVNDYYSGGYVYTPDGAAGYGMAPGQLYMDPHTSALYYVPYVQNCVPHLTLYHRDAMQHLHMNNGSMTHTADVSASYYNNKLHYYNQSNRFSRGGGDMWWNSHNRHTFQHSTAPPAINKNMGRGHQPGPGGRNRSAWNMPPYNSNRGYVSQGSGIGGGSAEWKKPWKSRPSNYKNYGNVSKFHKNRDNYGSNSAPLDEESRQIRNISGSDNAGSGGSMYNKNMHNRKDRSNGNKVNALSSNNKSSRDGNHRGMYLNNSRRKESAQDNDKNRYGGGKYPSYPHRQKIPVVSSNSDDFPSLIDTINHKM